VGVTLVARLWAYVFPGSRWKVSATVAEADLVPDRIGADSAVLVGTKALPKWLVFDCPCNSGHRIMLNLSKTRRPFWRIIHGQYLTVKPSIDFEENGRRCHYLIRNGHIIWVGDGEEFDGE
jgi:Family of unknown function (DUF6527)